MGTTHAPHIPDPIWKWAQRKSGKINPSSYIREVLWVVMTKDFEGEEPIPKKEVVAEDTFETQWAALGMEVNPADDDFTKARNEFVDVMHGEQAAIEFFRKGPERGMKHPRAWLIKWHRDRRSQA